APAGWPGLAGNAWRTSLVWPAWWIWDPKLSTTVLLVSCCTAIHRESQTRYHADGIPTRLGANMFDPRHSTPCVSIQHPLKLFIDGTWQTPSSDATLAVVSPVTEQEVARFAAADGQD